MSRRSQLFVNKKLQYSSFKNGTYIISFSPYVSTISFERVLKECYHRSKHSGIEKVKFDLTKVKFFDAFELGLTALWLLELKNKERKVEVEFPLPEMAAYYFLERYAFEEFLTKNDIFCIKQGEAQYKPYVDFDRAEFIPLKFAHENEFQMYLDRLSVEKEREPLLDSMKYFEVASGGALRAIVLKEIRDNIKKHANDISPYLIMTKFVASENVEKKKRFFDRIKNKAEYGIEWERQFFHNLLQLYIRHEIDDLTYFELVIGDGGRGIHNVLGQIEDCENKKEYEILDYAFEYDSTSDPEGRLELIKKWIGSIVEEYKEFPPATGLYQVKKVVKDYSGFLSVRSGKSILCYDFLSYPSEGRPAKKLITNWTWQFEKKNRELKNLSSFRGTQYKIYFPLHSPLYFLRKKYFEVPSYELYRFPTFEYTVISLKDYFSVTKVGLDAQLESLKGALFNNLRKEIDLLKKRVSYQNRGIILVDFTDIAPGVLSQKVLHYIVLDMIQRQNSYLTIVGVNVDENTLSQMKIVCSKVQNNMTKKGKTLIVLTENLKVEFCGVTEETQKILENLLKQPISIGENSENTRRIIDQNHHIIDMDVKKEKYYLCFPYGEVVNRLKQNLREDIKNVIFDESNKIFHPSIRVNIPSRYHVEGFFEIWKLVENMYWKNKLQKWVEYTFRLLNPTVVISVGKPCQELMGSVNIQTLKWISIVNPWDRFSITELITIDKNDKVVILTDVIGTGETLNKVLNFIYEGEISVILAIVDAREKKKEWQSEIKEEEYKYEGRSYKLESIVKKELRFHTEQKPGDWSYETIKLVEPSTDALIAEPIRPPEQPLWLKIEPREYLIEEDKVQDFPNPFIENVTFSSDGIAIGHFVTKSEKHITYFFLIPRIAEYYAQEIARVIEEDIKKTRKKSGKELNISHIFNPEYNPGVKTIVSALSSLVGGKPQPVSNDQIFNISRERKWDFGEIETALIFDDSFFTGFTLQRIIDIAYKSGSKFIFVYTLMNRSDSFTTSFISNLPYYGRVPNQIELEIKHLVDARIPMFSISDCPICRYIEKLESIKQEIESSYCNTFLTKEINKWKPKSVESLQEEPVLNDYLSIPKEQRVEKCSLRWKLEIAKEEVGARNELKRIVMNYEKKSQQVLNFIAVLYQEILYFFETQKEKYNEVFYFKDKMQEACRFFAKNFKILSENLGSIILIWYFIDSESLLDCLKEILDSFRENTQLIFETIGYILIGESLTRDVHSSELISILSLFRMKLEKLVDPEPHFQLGEVIKYLESKAEKLIPSALYRNYGLARRGCYYFDKKYSDIIESCRVEIKEEAIKSFEESINESSQKLRGVEAVFESNLLTLSETQKLKENYEKLKYIVDSFNRLLMEGGIEKERFMQMVGEFHKTVNSIDDILSIFKCDFKKVIDLAKKENIKLLEKKYNIKNIKIEIIVDDRKARFAFIREDHMKRILDELFDNLKYAFSERIEESSRNKVKISSRIFPSSDDFLCLEILDNGSTLTGKRFGRGHSLIRDFAEKYGGKFQPLEEIESRDDFWKEGYRKKSILYLGNLPPPQESIK